MTTLATHRRLVIEDEARKVFEKYHRLTENLCGEEVGPRGILPVQTELIISKIFNLKRHMVVDIPNQRGRTTAGSYDGTLVLISEGQSARAVRFTEAHEIGHMHLHPGEAHLRERSRDFITPRPLAELEADWFAANLLMPKEIATEEFSDRFGPGLARRSIDEDCAYALTNGKLSPSQIRKMSREQFVSLVAKAKWFNGQHFESLNDVFGVSADALERRLIELHLISDEE